MAIAVEALPEAAEATEGGASAAEGGASRATTPGGGWQAVSRASGQLRRAPAAAYGGYQSLSTPSQAAQTITKLIWAVALGLIVLEVAAQATGQTWSFALPGRGPKPAKQPYQPLYAGQATVTAAMPGVLPSTVGNTAPIAGQVVGLAP